MFTDKIHSQPLNNEQVTQWFLYWRSYEHGQLVDTLESAESPHKELMAFYEHDTNLHALAKATALARKRIELLSVLECKEQL